MERETSSRSGDCCQLSLIAPTWSLNRPALLPSHRAFRKVAKHWVSATVAFLAGRAEPCVLLRDSSAASKAVAQGAAALTGSGIRSCKDQGLRTGSSWLVSHALSGARLPTGLCRTEGRAPRWQPGPNTLSFGDFLAPLASSPSVRGQLRAGRRQGRAGFGGLGGKITREIAIRTGLRRGAYCSARGQAGRTVQAASRPRPWRGQRLARGATASGTARDVRAAAASGPEQAADFLRHGGRAGPRGWRPQPARPGLRPSRRPPGLDQAQAAVSSYHRGIGQPGLDPTRKRRIEAWGPPSAAACCGIFGTASGWASTIDRPGTVGSRAPGRRLQARAAVDRVATPRPTVCPWAALQHLRHVLLATSGA